MRTGLIVLALAATALAGCATTYASERSRILLEADLNNSGAQGAPQQAVAAEWAVRDMAGLLAQQNTEQSILLYIVIALLAISTLSLLLVASRVRKTNEQLEGMRKSLDAALAEPPTGGGGGEVVA